MPIWDSFLPDFVKMVRADTASLGKPEIFPLLKSSPTAIAPEGVKGRNPRINSGPFSMILGARIWLVSSIFPAFKRVAEVLFPNLIQRIEIMAKSEYLDVSKGRKRDELPLSPEPDKWSLGRLGFKVEAAGKVRVFAMVDAWTQWLLSPLHKFIFSILETIDEDGTFNQLQPVHRLRDRLYPEKVKGRRFSSIDLSAATDRLPIALQISLIEHLLENKVVDSRLFAEAWADLLVKRSYEVPVAKDSNFEQYKVVKGKYQVKKTDFIVPHTTPKEVFYAVGQPMGALSSWAMLAITHHAIVQLAARKAGFSGWFQDYAILGDDVIIAHGQVASRYRDILREIGVEAGLAKSIISRSRFVLEFAKKFFVDSTTANMLPLKECIAASTMTSMILEFVRTYDISLNAILAFKNYGYKARMRAVNALLFDLGTRIRVLLVWLALPSSSLGKSTYSEWLFMKSWYTSFEVGSRVKYQVWDIVAELAKEKSLKIFRFLEEYENSIETQIQLLKTKVDLSFTILANNSWEEGNLDSEKVELDWKDFISDKPIDTGYEVSDFKEANELPVIGTFDAPRQEEVPGLPTIEESVIKEFNEYIYRQVKLTRTMPLNIRDLDTRLEELLEWLMTPDPISALVPSTYWELKRFDELEKPFVDFSECYRLWQLASKPIWSAYHKGELDVEVSGIMDGSLVVMSEPVVVAEYPFRGVNLQKWIKATRPDWQIPGWLRKIVERLIGLTRLLVTELLTMAGGFGIVLGVLQLANFEYYSMPEIVDPLEEVVNLGHFPRVNYQEEGSNIIFWLTLISVIGLACVSLWYYSQWRCADRDRSWFVEQWNVQQDSIESQHSLIEGFQRSLAENQSNLEIVRNIAIERFNTIESYGPLMSAAADRIALLRARIDQLTLNNLAYSERTTEISQMLARSEEQIVSLQNQLAQSQLPHVNVVLDDHVAYQALDLLKKIGTDCQAWSGMMTDSQALAEVFNLDTCIWMPRSCWEDLQKAMELLHSFYISTPELASFMMSPVVG